MFPDRVVPFLGGIYKHKIYENQEETRLCEALGRIKHLNRNSNLLKKAKGFTRARAHTTRITARSSAARKRNLKGEEDLASAHKCCSPHPAPRATNRPRARRRRALAQKKAIAPRAIADRQPRDESASDGIARGGRAAARRTHTSVRRAREDGRAAARRAALKTSRRRPRAVRARANKTELKTQQHHRTALKDTATPQDGAQRHSNTTGQAPTTTPTTARPATTS